MQNSKPQITEKKRKGNLFWSIGMTLIACLYVGMRYGYFYATTEDATLFSAFMTFTSHLFKEPWMVFPTNIICIGIVECVGAIISILMYNKYLVFKDTVEHAHGDASFEEDYDQYEKEFVVDPKIVENLTNVKMTDKNCPRNEEGKKIYKKIEKPYSSKKFHDVVEACRQNSMVYTDAVYLSLNGSWCQRNTNSIVFGASGTGKSRYFLKPNILQANGSFICTDPSGDIMQECGYFLENIKGYKIKCFNISDMTKSCRFNPLYYIRDTKDIPIVAQTFLNNMKGEGASKGGDGDFWDKSAQALLCCCIGYLYEVCAMEQRNFSNVLELIRMDKHEEDEQGGTLSDFDVLFKNLGEANPASYAFQQYNTYTQAPVKTRNNILISTSVNLQQLDIPEVRNLTYKDEMELDLLGVEPMAIFLNIPQADATYCWLTAMLYSLLFKRLYSYGENRMKLSALGIDIDEYKKWCEANELPDNNESIDKFKEVKDRSEVEALSNPEMKIHVRFLIDECANVGKIPNLEKYLATCRKYRISIVPIFQNYSQIVETYNKEKANNIVSNCDAFLFLGGSDEDTIKIISGHLGKETVKTLNGSYTQGSKGSNSNSKQQTGKDLMTRDQIETMSNAECLLFIRALRPFKTKKYDLNRHPNYKYLSEGKEGDAYPNPFGLEYEDELIEGVRIKNADEEGYVAPKVVDSARRRNLITTNLKKVQELRELLPDLIAQCNTEPDSKKREKSQAIIDALQEEIRKLERVAQVPIPTDELTSDDKETTNEVPLIMPPKEELNVKGVGTIKKGEDLERQISDETKIPGTLLTNPTDKAPNMNPDFSSVISALAVGGYASAYEFDTPTDFSLDKFAKDDAKNSSGDDMSKEINSIMGDWFGNNPSDDMQGLIDIPNNKPQTVKVYDVADTKTDKILTGREPEMPEKSMEKSIIDTILSNEKKEENTSSEPDSYDPTEEFDAVNDVLGGFDDFY